MPQETYQDYALNMIADAMAMCLLHPLPGEDTAKRQVEPRAQGKARIAELAAECERDGWEYEVCAVLPQLLGETAPVV